MRSIRRMLLACTLLACLAVLVAPSASAQEPTGVPTIEAPGAEGEEPAAEGEEPAEEGDGKFRLMEDPEVGVGLILAGVTVVFVLLALDNWRRQLKGERPSTDGKWRPR